MWYMSGFLRSKGNNDDEFIRWQSDHQSKRDRVSLMCLCRSSSVLHMYFSVNVLCLQTSSVQVLETQTPLCLSNCGAERFVSEEKIYGLIIVHCVQTVFARPEPRVARLCTERAEGRIGHSSIKTIISCFFRQHAKLCWQKKGPTRRKKLYVYRPVGHFEAEHPDDVDVLMYAQLGDELRRHSATKPQKMAKM